MLVTNKEDINKYVNNSVSFEKIEEFINQAEIKYIIPVLGKEQYDELNNYHNESGSGSGSGSGSPDSKLSVLLEHTQRPLVNLAHWIFVPTGSVQFGDGGIRRIESDNLKTAFHYQEINLANSFKNSGFDFLDNLIEYLEENKTTFTKWAESEAYTLTKENFVNTSKEFTKIYSQINNSRLVFLNLKSHMTTVEDFDIMAAIGRAEFDDLKTKIKGTPSGKDLILIGIIQKAIVWLTVAKAANETGVSFTDKGLFFESLQSTSGGSLKEEVVKDLRLKKLIDDCKKNGNAYIQNAIDYLINNIDDFPLYKESDLYNDGESTQINTTTNKKIIVR